jgi:hypothetical protein
MTTHVNTVIGKIADLETGSNILNAEIALCAGTVPHDALERHKDGESWWTKSQGAWLPPRYTESLDAQLPGENIVLSRKKGDRWYATHASGTQGEAKTEANARRIATLRFLVTKRELAERQA